MRRRIASAAVLACLGYAPLAHAETFRILPEWQVTAGARYFHVSNAQQHGKEKNPGYNGIEYYVGIMWTWR